MMNIIAYNDIIKNTVDKVSKEDIINILYDYHEHKINDNIIIDILCKSDIDIISSLSFISDSEHKDIFSNIDVMFIIIESLSIIIKDNNPFLYQIVDRFMTKFTELLCHKKDIQGIKALYEKFYSYDILSNI